MASRLEGIGQKGVLLIGTTHFSPIDVVRTFFALYLAHEPATRVRSGIAGRIQFCRFQVGRIPASVVSGQGQAEAASGINLVKLQILRFEPGVFPAEIFTANEGI